MATPSDCPLTTGMIVPVCPRLMYTARDVFRSAREHLTSDLAADCRLQAQLAAWQIRHHLEKVAEEKRCAYCIKSVTRALWDFLSHELRYKQNTTALEDTFLAEEAVSYSPDSGHCTGISTGVRGELIQEVGDEALAQALLTLPSRARGILDLYYMHDQSDVEIGRCLGLSEEAAARARRRAIADLRKRLNEMNGKI